jgi:formylglycine-generating enzyme required for sulfatase activity
VAAAFLDRFERELQAEIEVGDVSEAVRWLDDLRRVAGESSRIERRFQRRREAILGALRARGEEAMRSGRRGQARTALRAALELAPDDPVVPRLLASLDPAAGEVRRWDGDGREMVWVPAGEFRMGASVGDSAAQSDEHPARAVRVEGFWLDRYEITNAEYRLCVDAGDCTAPQRTVMFDDPNLQQLPVMWVDWQQARAYARWAGKRLPTEAEWERAARAGEQTRYPWGTLWQEGAANAAGTAGDDRFGGSAPVGAFAPNRWGLYDMLGNAAEWVEDLYHRDYRDAPRDARAWNQFTGGPVERRRVIRGGSYDDIPTRLRVTSRTSRPPLDDYRTTGFRCAADGSEE